MGECGKSAWEWHGMALRGQTLERKEALAMCEAAVVVAYSLRRGSERRRGNQSLAGPWMNEATRGECNSSRVVSREPSGKV